MYRVEMARLYFSKPLGWSPLSNQKFLTEREAYERMARELQSDAELGYSGEFVYRVVEI